MSLCGVPIRFHWSSIFILIISIPILQVMGFKLALLFSIILLLSLIGHELAHAIAAKECGYHVKEILVMALGGAAHIEGFHHPDPLDEIKISAAGPLFNISAGLFFLPGVILAYGFGWPTLGIPLLFIVFINVMMSLLNLLPVYPMDGGRITRSTLALFLERDKANRITRIISCGLGIILILGGFIMIFSGSPFGGLLIVMQSVFMVLASSLGLKDES